MRLADPFSATFAAPAKINLRLKVEGKREDGYHLLSMINGTLNLEDTITLQLNLTGQKSIEVVATSPWVHLPDEVQKVSENLASKAAERFLEFRGLENGYSILIEKRIPIGAGLGGGSSDAAAMLRFLSDKYGGHKDALAIGEKLGADIPYLFFGGLSYVEGVGEIVRPADFPEILGAECVLILSPEHSSTKEVFAKFKGPFVRDRKVVESKNILSLIENDLTETVCEETPPIRGILQAILSVPTLIGGLTGSGSACFAFKRDYSDLDKKESVALESALKPYGVSIVRTRLV